MTDCEAIILEDAQQLASVLFTHHSFTLLIGIVIGFALYSVWESRNFYRAWFLSDTKAADLDD